MALFPTKKITALAPAVLPLTGSEEFECVQLGNSRKATSRAFVLPTDSLITFSAMGGSLPGSRQITAGIGIVLVDGGPGTTLEINATGAVAGPANPTALLGLTAINGVAITYMRSDAAPALNQAIVPEWTGAHRWHSATTQLLIGSSLVTARQIGAITAKIQVEGNNNNSSGYSAVRNNPSAQGAYFTLAHSRGTAPGGIDIVLSGDIYGQVDFAGADGVNLVSVGASFRAQVDGAPAVGSMPGRLVFLTTPIGAITPSERLRISENGAWGLAGAVFGNAGDVLTSNGSGAAITWQSKVANPTALVGLAAVNGVATTAMRSDGAPALDQGIAPTWTAQHIFSLAGSVAVPTLLMSSTQPVFEMRETDAAANNQRWDIILVSEQLRFRVKVDSPGVVTDWMTVDRTGTTVDSIALTSTALTWNGSPILTTATTFANPTASVGLAAVNGAATTAMRSDAAPALSVAIVPTWTGLHTWSNVAPSLRIFTTGAAADRKDIRFEATAAGQLQLNSYTDAGALMNTLIIASRAGGGFTTATFGTTNGGVTLTGSTLTLAATTTIAVTGTTSTWSPLHTFTAEGTNAQSSLTVAANRPEFELRENDAAADNERWNITALTEQFVIRALNDAGSVAANILVVDRTGTDIDSITLECRASGGTIALDANAGSLALTGSVVTPNLLVDEAGYKGFPQNSQAGNYTLVLNDVAKFIYSTGASATITIPANASVAYPIGTEIMIVASGTAGSRTIAITTDSLFLAGVGTTGSRTLAPFGVAYILKVASNQWFISGTGVT